MTLHDCNWGPSRCHICSDHLGPAGTQGLLCIRKAGDMRPNQPRAKLLIQLCKQAPSRHARDQRHVGTVAHGSWVELTYGAHSTHGLRGCPFDRLSIAEHTCNPRDAEKRGGS